METKTLPTLAQLSAEIEPIEQPRHKFTRSGKLYIPGDHPVHAYKRRLRSLAELAYWHGRPTTVPLGLSAIFGMPLTESLGRRQRLQNDRPHVDVPDLDNLLKSTVDAITGVWWRDDRQIASLVARKVYAASGRPYVRLRAYFLR